MKFEQLSEIQRDALREVCSISAGNAATAISEMVKKKIAMSVPEVRLVPVTEAAEIVGGPEKLVVGVYSSMIGDLSGEFLLMFPREYAFSLSDILLNKMPGDTKLLGDMEQSAMEETGNIITATFVNALAKMIGKDIVISVPKCAYDMAGAIIDFILIELAEEVEYALVLEIVFHDVPETIRGKFFILPNPKSLELLLMIVEGKTGGK